MKLDYTSRPVAMQSAIETAYFLPLQGSGDTLDRHHVGVRCGVSVQIDPDHETQISIRQKLSGQFLDELVAAIYNEIQDYMPVPMEDDDAEGP